MAHTIVAARKPFKVSEVNLSIDWTITSAYPGSLHSSYTRAVDAAIPTAGGWSEETLPAPTPPDPQLYVIRISATEDGGGNILPDLLAVKIGSTLNFVNPAASSQNVNYIVTLAPVDMTTYVEYTCTLGSISLGGKPPVGTLTDTSELNDPIYYAIRQTSFDPTVAEELGVNISPFATDRFVHIPKDPTPLDIESPVTGERVDVFVDNLVVVREYECYDGWETYQDGTLGISTTDLIRVVSRHSLGYVTAKVQNLNDIQWRTNTGKVHTGAVDIGAITSSVFPIVHPALGVDETDGSLTITGRDAGNLTIWELHYTFECPWEGETVTIGFINRFGVWEYFDALGRYMIGTKSHKEQYVSYATGLIEKYNVNGNRTLTVNTGWVGENFDSVYEDLLMSEAIVLYRGTPETNIRLSLETESVIYEDDRNQKMISYIINFQTAGKVIPII